MKQSIRRFCAGAMTAILTVTSTPFAAIAKTTAGDSGGGSDVAITQDNDARTLTIGNDQISRTFSWDDGSLETDVITNLRAGTTLIPGEKSEEFIFRATKGESTATSLPSLGHEGWSATADSEEDPGREQQVGGPVRFLIDDNAGTYWHTKYKPTEEPMPHWAVMSLGGEKTFQSFSYTPRNNGEQTNGNIKGYKLYASNADTAPAGATDDGWKLISEGEFTYNGVNPIYVNLEKETTAKHLKLVATSSKTGKVFAGGAEFNLHADKAPEVKNDREFKASELTVKSVTTGDVETTFSKGMVNERTERGMEAVVEFEPVNLKGVDYTVKEHVVMYDGDHYMRKFLEFSVPSSQAAQAEVDYIDLESLDMTGAAGQWSIPTGKGGIVQMNEFKANLGQPIYAEGMFFGCEFPETDTEIKDELGYMRYYSGKTFERLVTDKQAGASEDGSTVTYNTWQTVAGAARDKDTSVVRSDFYEYITDIATPSDFRTQYNSWFDNMMEIDDQNIADTFKEFEKQMSDAGAAPLGSYVVDDGWNNYNDTERSVDVKKSGTGKNTKGFWAFNSKFPNELYPSSSLAQKFGSNFGMWVGPRGGYNFYSNLANILVNNGTGHKSANSNDIDVASRTYVGNFEKMALDYQDRFHVNYWKWDGFANQAQFNGWSATEGVASRANDHMVGGYQNMYHVTDLWEAWTDLFDAVRLNQQQNGIPNLWISLTCYVNPSPWFLQWANSVWMQCVHDQADAGYGITKLDKQMNYRDACYYDFINGHQFQFPLANVYNHDPVYGKKETGMDKNTADDVQFANYLYTQAGRGTAFWELYFSESLMTEGKWQVTAKFLEWAEQNNHILRNAKMFGTAPAANVKLDTYLSSYNGGGGGGAGATYGYAGFDGTEGLITLRNSATSAQDINFTFDAATTGVPIESDDYDVVVERVYNPKDSSAAKDTPSDKRVSETTTMSYGKQYTFNLQQCESITLRVTKSKDAEAPKIASVTTDGDKTITVKFDEFVKLSEGQTRAAAQGLTVDGADVESIEASADRVTFDIKLAKAPKAGAKLTVKAGGSVADAAGNAADSEASVVFRKGNKVASKSAELAGNTAKLGTAAKSLAGENPFSIDLAVTTESADTVLASQPGAYTIGLNAEGKPYATVGELTATADAAVNDGAEHKIAVERVANGMIKVYVDGELSGSVYGKDIASLTAGQAILGSEQFSGKISAVVYDIARGYDGISGGEQPEQGVHNVASNKDAATFRKDGSSFNKIDRAASMAVDGKKDSDNYAEFGEDGKTDGGYLQVDFGALYDIKATDGSENDAVKMWRYFKDGRTYRDTVIVLSEDETFGNDDDTVVWNSDSSGYFGFGAGTDQNYAETASGRGFAVKAGTKARYARVYMHGQSDSKTTNHIVELEVYGEEVVEPEEVDKTELKDLIATAEKTETEGKTDESVKALKEAIEAAKKVLDDDAATQEAVDEAVSALDEAIEGLEDVPAPTIDKTKLAERVEELNGISTEGKTPESIEAFKAKIAKAQEVLDDEAADQAAVDAALKALEGAEGLLVDIPVVNKNALQEAITAAVSHDASGNTVSSIAKFETARDKAVKAARAVLDNDDATQKDVDAAVSELADAMDAARALLEARVSDGNLIAASEQLARYEGLAETDYTAETWAAFVAARDAVNAVLTDASDTTDAQLAKLVETLTSAVDSLEKAPVPVDTSKLEAAILEAKNFTPEGKTASSVAAFAEARDAALAAAQQILATEGATQEQVDEALEAFNQAFEDAKGLLADRVSDKKLAKAQKLVDGWADLSEADYTPETWVAYAKALDKLNAVLADPSDTTAKQLNKLVKKATKAHDALELAAKPADKTALEAAIVEAKNVSVEGKTASSAAEFKAVRDAALEAAQAVMVDEAATQEQVDKAASALSTAVADAAAKLVDRVSDDALAEAKKVVDGWADLSEADYTPETWAAYAGALSAVNAVLTDPSDTSGAQLDELMQKLVEAHDALAPAFIPADKTELEAAIVEAKNIDVNGKTTSTADEFKMVRDAAIEAAQAVMADEAATQVDVDKAVSALKTGIAEAQAKLVDRVSDEDLAEAKKVVDGWADLDEKTYTELTWKAYACALDAVKAVLDDPSDTSGPQLDELMQNLVKAHDELEVLTTPVDKSMLEAAIVEAKNIDVDGKTKSTADEFKMVRDAALDAAQAVMMNDDATQEQVDQAREDLAKTVSDAAAKLVDRVSDDALAEAKKVVDGWADLAADDYTAETWAAYAGAIDAVSAALADPSDTSEPQLDKLMQKLVEAHDALVEVAPAPAPEVDRSGLDAAINDAQNVDVTGYTAESVKAFGAKRDEAVSAAKVVMADESATQEQVDAAAEALNAAIAEAKQLLVAEEGETPDPEPTPTPTPEPGDGSGAGGGSGTSGTKPQAKPSDGAASKKEPGTLVKTGDDALLYMGAAAAAGVIALGAAGVVRRRRG